jgi:hypothetical protein
MELTYGGFHRVVPEGPSSSSGKEGNAMGNPEIIGSYGSAGFILNSISTRRTTKPTSSPLEVSVSMLREGFVENVPYSGGYCLILDLRSAPLFLP